MTKFIEACKFLDEKMKESLFTPDATVSIGYHSLKELKEVIILGSSYKEQIKKIEGDQ